MKKIFNKIPEFFSKFYSNLKIFYQLFKKEGVFKYFIVILVLNLIAGLIFLFLEYEKVISSISNPNAALPEKIITVIYWAIVTIATIGYGDITPVSPAGRIMTIALIYLSVATVALFTANLTSALTTKKFMERRGIMDLSSYKDHFIICGWKISMAKILNEILSNNPEFDLGKIIIIANIEADAIELFKQQYPDYEEIIIIRGEHYNETLLRKANILKAAKVLILADESTSSASQTETDSKTIMTVMTIRGISLNIRVCAELLDAKFEKYLQSAHIDDIIYTNEYSKVLIANSFLGIGVSKVINDLLNITTPAYISTAIIPKEFFGKKYFELKDNYNKKNTILIGLLENVGSYSERKMESLREAQKTADVHKLIANLKTAKKLETNLPNITPEDSYIIPDHSMAIIIGKRTN